MDAADLSPEEVEEYNQRKVCMTVLNYVSRVKAGEAPQPDRIGPTFP